MLFFRRKFSNGITAQPRGGFGRGLYGGRGEQIMQRQGNNKRGHRGERNVANRGGNQIGPQRDPNVMDVDKGRGEDRTCYHCGKWGHMTRNCWKKNKAKVVDIPQESAKENGGQ